jgi:hypothetical protein
MTFCSEILFVLHLLEEIDIADIDFSGFRLCEQHQNLTSACYSSALPLIFILVHDIIFDTIFVLMHDINSILSF